MGTLNIDLGSTKLFLLAEPPVLIFCWSILVSFCVAFLFSLVSSYWDFSSVKFGDVATETPEY